MPYQQEISSQHPALFVFLLDQSYSMEEPIGGNNPGGCRKMDQLAMAVNSWFQNMTIRATGAVWTKPWIDVAVIGCRTDQKANPIIESALDGELGERARRENRMVFSITEIGETPSRIEQRMKSFFDEDTGEVTEVPEEAPVWVEPKAEGRSPMCSALRVAYDIIDQWIQDHRDSFPPIVIHITDGQSDEGDPLPCAEPIMRLETTDGQVLLFNNHLSESHADPFLFPSSDETLPNEEACVLFHMSSILPDPMYERAIAEGFDLQPAARGMAFNSDMVMIIKFLDMGTRVAKWEQYETTTTVERRQITDVGQDDSPGDTVSERAVKELDSLDDPYGHAHDVQVGLPDVPPDLDRQLGLPEHLPDLVEEIDSIDDPYSGLLREMPAIAEAVNAFHSEAVQIEAFRSLVAAFRSLAPTSQTRGGQLPRSDAVPMAAPEPAPQGRSLAYKREISRQHPALFVFLLDQSHSMQEPVGGDNPDGKRKMDQLAIAVNSWLQNMSIRATGSEGIKHFMDVALIGYRTDQEANPIIESPLGGELGERARRENRMVFSVTEIGVTPSRIEQRTRSCFDEETGEEVEFPEEAPIWVEPKAEGRSPMCSALRVAYDIIDQWIQEHRDNFPPIVIHITDGQSDEGDPLPYAEAIMALETTDGHVLLFNNHLSESHADPFQFPHSEETLPDEEARVLFRMSSILPDPIYERAITEGSDLQPAARGMAFNADMVTLIRFLDMGTRVALR